MAVMSFSENRKIPTISYLYEMVASMGTVMFGVRETKPVMNENRTYEAGWYMKVCVMNIPFWP